MCLPQVPRLRARCDPQGAAGWESVERTAADGEVTAQSGEWMSSLGKGKNNNMSLSFFLFEVTKLQGSGGNCCSDFFLWEAGGCVPEAAAHGVIYIARSLWFKREALPFLRSSASLESGPLPHTDCICPLIFSPPLPLPDLLGAV